MKPLPIRLALLTTFYETAVHHCQSTDAFTFSMEHTRGIKTRPAVSPFDDSQLFIEQTCATGCYDEKNQLPSNPWNRFISSIVASLMILGLAMSSPPPCHATANTPTISTFSTNSISINKQFIHCSSSLLIADDSDLTEEEIKSLGLKPPTESKPQIALPKNYSPASQGRRPLLQGLVYFIEQETISSAFPQEYNDDLLVLTAIPVEGKPILLAGAKIPISTIRFPFIFKMYKENSLLKSRQDVWLGTYGGDQQDVLVEARICPRESGSFPCSASEQKRFAKGIAKVISNLPGMAEGDVVRAPASLPLQ